MVSGTAKECMPQIHVLLSIKLINEVMESFLLAMVSRKKVQVFSIHHH